MHKLPIKKPKLALLPFLHKSPLLLDLRGSITIAKKKTVVIGWLCLVILQLTRITHIPRKKKLQERAHIGDLIGYDSTNVFSGLDSKSS